MKICEDSARSWGDGVSETMVEENRHCFWSGVEMWLKYGIHGSYH